MEGTRKNVGSEYKKVGKWGFVPKLGVALLAALIILSLAGCKNAVDGGVGSSGGGGAPAAARDDVDGVAYAFMDAGITVGSHSDSGEKTFAEIKSYALTTYVEESGFLGWEIEGTGNLATDEHIFSENTTFVASYEPAGSGYKAPVQVDFVGNKSDDDTYTATYGWYNQATQEYLFFKDSGYAYVIKAGLLKSSALISDYVKCEEAKNIATKNFRGDDKSTHKPLEDAKKALAEYEEMLKNEYGFCELNFIGDDWDWTSETKKVCVYDFTTSWDPKYEFYLNQQGNALLYASGENEGKIAFIRDEIQM